MKILLLPLKYEIKTAIVTVNFSLSSLRAKLSNNNCYRDSWKSDIFRERAPSKKKQRTYTKNDAKMIKCDNFTRKMKTIGKINDWMAQ